MNTQIIQMGAKFQSTCLFCGEKIEINQEFFWYKDTKEGFHITCPPIKIYEQTKYNKAAIIQTAFTNETKLYKPNIEYAPVKTNIVQAHLLPDLIKLFDGRFTIEYENQNKTKSGYVVVWMKTRTAEPYIGSRRIRVHIVRTEGKRYVDAAYITKDGKLVFRRGFIESVEFDDEQKKSAMEAVKVVVSGQNNDAYAMNYAMITNHCWHCNLPLTNPDTLRKYKFMGPVCYKNHPEDREKIRENIQKPKPLVFDL